MLLLCAKVVKACLSGRPAPSTEPPALRPCPKYSETLRSQPKQKKLECNFAPPEGCGAAMRACL
eukprot:scaffold125512_cov20-Prasinocladus_malaysianus.AAC.1